MAEIGDYILEVRILTRDGKQVMKAQQALEVNMRVGITGIAHDAVAQFGFEAGAKWEVRGGRD